jgi:hypothetical protein
MENTPTFLLILLLWNNHLSYLHTCRWLLTRLNLFVELIQEKNIGGDSLRED